MADEVFRHDGYLSEFEAGVVATRGDDVILDCTGFYPGGGGQVCDTGSINGVRVTDVHYEGKEIVHTVPGNKFEPGERVWCSVDWDRRYDLMMGHTAEHLLFCSLHRLDPELEITKIYISPEEKYVIVNHDVPWETVGEAVRYANDRIADNLPVRKTVMDRSDPDLAKVRIKLDRIGEDEEITVVNIGDIDYSACSGVHVQETSEIGMIFVDRKVSAGKDGVAIHFKVGKSASDAAAELANLCLRVIDECASKPSDIVKTVANMRRDLAAAAEAGRSATKTAVAALRPEDVNGMQLYSGLFPGADKKVLTEAADRIASEGRVCVFVSTGTNVSVIMASGSKSVDCKAILPGILARYGGRGGGKPAMVQGGIPDAKDADALLADAVEAVRAAQNRGRPHDCDRREHRSRQSQDRGGVREELPRPRRRGPVPR